MADLKPPLNGYSLWFEANAADQQFLQSLVDDLAREHSTRSFRAHATLMGLLDKTTSDVDTIKQACEKIARGYQGAVTEIIGVGIRDMYFQSVFLLVTPSRDLTTMNQQARELLGHENDPPFMPHWSAVYGDLDQPTKASIARDVITKVTFPRVVPITGITLVDVQGYPDEWKIVARYPLKGA